MQAFRCKLTTASHYFGRFSRFTTISAAPATALPHWLSHLLHTKQSRPPTVELEREVSGDDTAWTPLVQAVLTGNYKMWCERSNQMDLMQMWAEEQEHSGFHFTKLLDKETLVHDVGFHERISFDEMAKLIEAALKQEMPDQLKVEVTEQSGGQTLLVRIKQVSMFGTEVPYDIVLVKQLMSEAMLLKRNVAVLEQEKADMMQEMAALKKNGEEVVGKLEETVRGLEEELVECKAKSKASKARRDLTIAALKKENETLIAKIAAYEGVEDEKKEDGGGSGSEVAMQSKLVWKQTWAGHSDDIYSVSMSVDGRVAVSGSDDKSIRVWDVEKGECLSVTEGAHSFDVTCVLLTSDQTNVISCDWDGSIKSWSFDGRELKLIWEEKFSGKLWRMCLNDDETMIAAVCRDNKHCLVYNRVDAN